MRVLNGVRCFLVLVRFSPVGVCFLLASKVILIDDLLEMIMRLAYYASTVLAGLAIHGLIVLPVIFVILTKRNPWSPHRGHFCSKNGVPDSVQMIS